MSAPTVARKPSQAAGRKPSQAAGRKPSQAAGRKPSQAAGRKPSQAAGRKPSQAAGKQSSSSAKQSSQSSERNPQPTRAASPQPSNPAQPQPQPKTTPKPGPRFRKLYFFSFLVGVVALVVTPFAIVFLHVSLLTGQHQLDDLRLELNQQLELRQQLLYDRSQAVSPERIRAIAIEVLGMVPADDITYLQSVGSGADG